MACHVLNELEHISIFIVCLIAMQTAFDWTSRFVLCGRWADRIQHDFRHAHEQDDDVDVGVLSKHVSDSDMLSSV